MKCNRSLDLLSIGFRIRTVESQGKGRALRNGAGKRMAGAVRETG
jgi:hypothetical protein